MQYYGTLKRAHARAAQEDRQETCFDALAPYPQERIQPESATDYTRFETPALRLQDGDRLSVFNSIAAGNTVWKGKLDFRGEDPTRGANPAGIPKSQWYALCNAHLPAKLTIAKTGETIDGALRTTNDAPHDGFGLWDFSEKAFGSLHGFRDGDTLEIFSSVTAGGILWQGDIKIQDSALEIICSLSEEELKILEDGGVFIGEYVIGLERLGNPLTHPPIKEAEKWFHTCPIQLERA